MTDTANKTQSTKPVTGARFDTLLAQINDLHHREFFNKETTHLKESALSFYPDYTLLTATERATFPSLTMRFITNSDDSHVVKIDHTKQPVEELNNKAPVQLSSETILDYVRFYFGAVYGDEGSFDLVESYDDVGLTEEIDEDVETLLAETITPLHLVAPADKNSSAPFEVDFYMIYAGCFYHARAGIQHNGTVEIANEEQPHPGLPVRTIRLK